MTVADTRDRRSVMASSAKVRLRGLAKIFSVKGRPIEALAGIDLDIQAGEFFCIVGPSGCGKTTMLRILAGLERQTSGSIEVARDSSASRPLNSMVFQEQSIFPWLNVRDNVAFGLKSQGLSRGERYRVVEPWISKVGLTGFQRPRDAAHGRALRRPRRADEAHPAS
jgi:NitT/TauT family transport system ATP-binding protein